MAFLPQRPARLDAGVIKLGGLTDYDRSRANDHHRPRGHAGAVSFRGGAPSPRTCYNPCVRRRLALLVVAAALAGCQTESYKETMQLAGTSWVAADRDRNDPGAGFSELQFSSKLSPAGMGQVRLAAGVTALYQVIDGKLVMRSDPLAGTNRTYDFSIDGNRLTIVHLSQDGRPEGSQHFTRR